jgi:hypothetical protein
MADPERVSFSAFRTLLRRPSRSEMRTTSANFSGLLRVATKSTENVSLPVLNAGGSC